jgi:hypothetical protein
MSEETGTWLAYCPRERLISLEEIARRIATDPEVTLPDPADDVLTVRVHDRMTGTVADIWVGSDTGSHVILEAQELVERDIGVDPGVPAPDLALLALCDARYELIWELQFSVETYNVMMVLVDILQEACGAIVHDITNDRFV